jgi:nucleoside-diphosphate-sugar epimerase
LLADPAVATVRSVARRPLPSAPKLVHIQADLREDAAREALAGVEVLFHLGFALWRGREASLVNIDGTRNILAGRPARVALASSAAVYGAWPDNPLPLSEDAWPRPNRECGYALDKLRVERLCESVAPTVALRLAAVLGPHADPAVARAVRGYRMAVPAGWGKRVALQFLDEADAAAAVHRAGTSAVTGVVNISPADWLSPTDVARIAGSRVVRVPQRALQAASEVAFRLRRTPFGSDRAVLINGPLALDPTRARVELGWTASKTSAEVLAAALRN